MIGAAQCGADVVRCAKNCRSQHRPGCARTERICSCIFTFRLAASTAAASAEWVWPTVTCISSFCEQTTCMLTKRWSFKDIENATIRIKQSVVVGGTQQTMSVCHTVTRHYEVNLHRLHLTRNLFTIAKLILHNNIVLRR